MSLSERLKQARKRAGLTQAELAERAGIKQASVSEIERGLTRNSGYLVKMAQICGVDPVWLAEGTVTSDMPIHTPEQGINLPRSLEFLANALQNSDDITLDQVRLLLSRLVDSPSRASEIVPRISDLLPGR